MQLISTVTTGMLLRTSVRQLKELADSSDNGWDVELLSKQRCDKIIIFV